MAHRYVRNTAILAKIETTEGTDPTPTGAADAMLVSNLTSNPLNANNVDRDIIRPFLGGSEQLVGTHYVELGFDVELAGSGAAGTAPAWGCLLRACAFAETITASTAVEYSPITNSQESVTVYWYDDGVLHKMTGAKGTFELKAGIGERPVLSFKFTGVYNAPTAASAPSLTLTGWKKPLVITDTNSGDILFGCTYATQAIAGGTAIPSKGLSFDMANTVPFIPLLGGDSVDITNRQPTFKAEFDMTAAQEVTKYTEVLANTTQAVGFKHGTTAGNMIELFMPNVQLINPGMGDYEGRRMVTFDGRVTPSAGNDDVTICVK